MKEMEFSWLIEFKHARGNLFAGRYRCFDELMRPGNASRVENRSGSPVRSMKLIIPVSLGSRCERGSPSASETTTLSERVRGHNIIDLTCTDPRQLLVTRLALRFHFGVVPRFLSIERFDCIPRDVRDLLLCPLRSAAKPEWNES